MSTGTVPNFIYFYLPFLTLTHFSSFSLCIPSTYPHVTLHSTLFHRTGFNYGRATQFKKKNKFILFFRAFFLELKTGDEDYLVGEEKLKERTREKERRRRECGVSRLRQDDVQ